MATVEEGHAAAGRKRILKTLPSTVGSEGFDDPRIVAALAPLHDKERAFVLAYVATWNPRRAARMAGYAKDRFPQDKLLSRQVIKDAIRAITAAAGISQEEILAQIRSLIQADITDFDDCYVVPSDNPYAGRQLDLAKVAEKGLGHAIRAVKPTQFGDQIVMYDRLAVLSELAKCFGLYREQVKVTAKIDLNKLSDEQLRCIANGKIPAGIEDTSKTYGPVTIDADYNVVKGKEK